MDLPGTASGAPDPEYRYEVTYPVLLEMCMWLYNKQKKGDLKTNKKETACIVSSSFVSLLVSGAMGWGPDS